MTAVDPVVLGASLAVTCGFLVAVITAVWWFDRYDREPWPLVVMVFLWGLLAAPALATGAGLIVSLGSDSGFTYLIPIAVAPLIEEMAKGVGILLVVVFSQHFDNPTDGLVYGTAVGLGFAVTENLLYGIFAGPRMVQGDALSLILTRTVFTAGIHALASSAVGAGLGFGRTAGRRWLSILWALLGLTVAVALHGAWNYAVTSVAPTTGWAFPAMILGPLYATYVAAFVLMLWGEHRILVKQMSEEVSLGVLPGWAQTVIPYYHRRVRSDWWPSRQERIVISRLLTRLAFRKHALEARGASANLQGLEVVLLRARIQGILGKPGVDEDVDEYSVSE